MKRILTLAVLFSLMACQSNSSEQSESIVEESESTPVVELTLQQELALEAFNSLQRSGTGENRLYSTFSGIEHDNIYPDTTFTITREQLQATMNYFTAEHYAHLRQEHRDTLVARAVKAQEEYTVQLDWRGDTAHQHILTGTWLLSDVLNQRDIVLIW